MNIGEKVEILTKLVLIYIRDMGKVESVSIGDKECRSLPDSIQSINDIKLLDFLKASFEVFDVRK